MHINDLPRHKKVYFLGIGGISMSSLAHILIEQGYDIVGYDRAKSELTSMLEGLGAVIWYDGADCELSDVGACIYSAAFGAEHPQMLAVTERAIPTYSRAELLGAIAHGFDCSIGVAGTHGKSSTTAMIYSMLCADGSSPSVLDGAVINSLGTQYHIGNSGKLVFECCEYKDSFLSFCPHIAVVLNVELDHTDYFHSIEQMRSSFAKFMSNTGSDGCAVVNFDSDEAMKAAEGYAGRLITFSLSGNRNADCYVTHCEYEHGRATDYSVVCMGRRIDGFQLSVLGHHSVANSLAAICCGVLCGLTDEQIKCGIAAYSGIGRRFEYKGRFCGADVYSDYAHHPDEIRVTLATAKELGASRVVTVFQPHTYSRLHDLFDGFCEAFDDSDLTVFAETFSARETNVSGISPADLCKRVKNSVYLPTFDEIEAYLAKNLLPGDVLVIMGAGDIDNLCKIAQKE